MALKWQELRNYLDRMTPAQLNTDVAIHLHSCDEFYQVSHAELCDGDEEDRLDGGAPYLVVLDVGLTTPCSICGKDCQLDEAHLHDGQYIGDECCWDDRLKGSE